jgi:rhamnogalacturonyl hydrolase YesR
MKITLYILAAVLASAAVSCTGGGDGFTDKNVEFAAHQTRTMLASLGDAQGRYPRTLDAGGALVTTDIYGWTSGFFPGTLWNLYELTGDEFWRERAAEWTAPLEPNKDNTRDHDVGFMMYCSYGNGLRLTADPRYAEILVATANSLSTRFNPVVGSIRSWEGGKPHDGGPEWQYPVIIDNMMNLELLMWAYRHTGDVKYRDIATTHADTTMKNHLRDDFSTYHLVDYDPATGLVNSRVTVQGYADNSIWARGQAWGIYGFTMMYRETGEERYLETAEKMADRFLNHPSMPADLVPQWDFNAGQEGYLKDWTFDETALGYIPRDASSAAIASSALLELSGYLPRKGYFAKAEAMLHTLASEKYRATADEDGGFILMHSTGSLPHGKEIDVPLVYADYYFVEALKRYGKK